MSAPPWILAALPPGMEVGADGKLVLKRVDAPAQPRKDLPPCEKCEWNIRNRCEHPAQVCAPCKQGVGLDLARQRPDFKCPLNLKKSKL